MTLTGEAREAILNMDIEKLTEKRGVNNLMAWLDKMYFKDGSSQTYETYKTFEKCVRPSGMSLSDYVIKLEQLYFKAKSFYMEILHSVLVYRSLNSASLTNEQKQLIKATVRKMNYQIMKDQLKKIFTSTSVNVDNKNDVDKIDVKPEENEVFYTSRNKNYGQQITYRGSFNRNNQNFKNKNYNKKMNALDNTGEISKSNFCGSKFHWEKSCPDAAEKYHNDLWLYEQLNIAFLEHSAESLVSETFSMALFDSRCTKTVCEETRLQYYLHSLSFDEYKQIETSKRNSSFRFGESELVKSFKKVKIPVIITGVQATVRTDFVEYDITLLLSRETMKKAKT